MAFESLLKRALRVKIIDDGKQIAESQREQVGDFWIMGHHIALKKTFGVEDFLSEFFHDNDFERNKFRFN